jgi:hypothetical protein
VASVCGCFNFLLFSVVNSQYWSCISISQRDLEFYGLRGVADSWSVLLVGTVIFLFYFIYFNFFVDFAMYLQCECLSCVVIPQRDLMFWVLYGSVIVEAWCEVDP